MEVRIPQWPARREYNLENFLKNDKTLQSLSTFYYYHFISTLNSANIFILKTLFFFVELLKRFCGCSWVTIICMLTLISFFYILGIMYHTGPWSRKWQPTPVFWPGQSHEQRSLADYSPWGCKESDMTEQLNMLTSYRS